MLYFCGKRTKKVKPKNISDVCNTFVPGRIKRIMVQMARCPCYCEARNCYRLAKKTIKNIGQSCRIKTKGLEDHQQSRKFVVYYNNKRCHLSVRQKPFQIH